MAERRANATDLSARINLATGGAKAAAPKIEGAATPPFAAFEWMIALRYLRAKRKERFVSVISVISLIGIALGVATLIIVMSVMNGFRHELLARILGLNGHVIVQGTSEGIPDFDKVVGRIKAIPGVTRAAPIVEGQVLASAGGRAAGALVRGIRKQDLNDLTMVSKTITAGGLSRFDGGDSVIIGARLADKLGVIPGMNITLTAPQGNITPFGTTPRVKVYTIAGTFKVGMSEYDQTFVFMPLDEAQLYFNLDEHNVGGIEVMVGDADQANAMSIDIANAAGPLTRVLTWQQMNSSLFGALQVERNVMFLILTLIILVAALNIISGLIMLVKDKSGDIAIMRTMGATRGAMMRVFLIAGASIGVFGTFFGFIIGTVFCAYIEDIRLFLSSLTGTTLFDPTIYFLSQMPAELDMGEVIAVVLMSLALSLLATLYPSWRAARLDPVEALRYE
jgi:lipoprotein-releasing system permease protein